MSFQDTLKRIQEENSLNNISINNPPVITVDEDNNNSNESSLGSLLSAFGIGASNMVNNTVLGGVLGQLPGFLGSYVEKFSPFSGEQNEDVLRLVKMGFPLKEAREIYPYRDSWLTSLGKSSLALNNYIGDYIQDWRNNTLGDNPTFAEQAMEGAGSSLGFMGTGLLTALGTGNPFLGAIASGATEALSESGGTLADAYRQGMYNQGLEAADKSFAANLALNSVLNAFLGPFNSKTAGIRNPVTRHLRGTAEQVLNEIIQEPSQKVIENAAAESMHNGGEFVSALGGQIPQWGDYFSELAPSVTASTLITQGLLGLGGMATPNIRQSWARQYTHRNEDTQQAENRLQEHYDAIQRLRNRLERELSGNNNQAVIDSLNSRIEKRMRQIQNITDAFRLYDFMPSQENSNNDDFTADVALDNNQSAKTKYKLVELDSIEMPENLKSDNETVSNITENFDPAAFGANESYNLGAPVISPQEGIEYGNERLDALRQIYTSDPEKTSHYRNWLVDNADSFGYDSREVQHMKYPVLVRQRISEIQNNNQPSATQNAGQGNAQNTENETLPPKKGTRKRNKNPENTAPLVPNTEEVQGENNSENQANTNPTENTTTVSETESNTHNPQMDMNTTENQRLNSLNNEAFYGNDEFYSDSGGDNSAPNQDIPDDHIPDYVPPKITALGSSPIIDSQEKSQKRKNSKNAAYKKGFETAQAIYEQIDENPRDTLTLLDPYLSGDALKKSSRSTLLGLCYGLISKSLKPNMQLPQDIEDEELRKIIKATFFNISARADRKHRAIDTARLNELIAQNDAVIENGNWTPEQINLAHQIINGITSRYGSLDSRNLYRFIKDKFGDSFKSYSQGIEFIDEALQKFGLTPIDKLFYSHELYTETTQETAPKIDRYNTLSRVLNRIREQHPEHQAPKPAPAVSSLGQNSELPKTQADGITEDVRNIAGNQPQTKADSITFDEALGKVAEIIYKSYNNSPNTLHPIKEIWDYTQHLPLDLAAKIDDYLNQHHIIKGFSSGNLDDATYKVNDIDALRAILPKKATTQEKQKSDTPSNATLPELENSYAGIKKDEKNAIAERKPEPQTQEAPEPEAQNTGKRIIPEGATYPRNLRQKRLTVKGLNWNGHDYGDVDFSVSWNFDYQKEGGEKREYIYIEPTKNTFIREKTIEIPRFFYMIDENDFFADHIVHGGIDKNAVPAVEKAFREHLHEFYELPQKETESVRNKTQNENATYEQNSFNQGGLQNTQNAPNDNQNNNYDGFIGFLDVNEHNSDSHSVNIFLDDYNGKPYLDFTDENGDSVAVFDINSNSFTIRPEHFTNGWVRNIEGNFRRNFSKNPTEEILRRSFRQKAIDAGADEHNADAAATVYMAGNKFFAKYSGQSLFDTVKSDNISIQKGENQQNNNSRGETTFVEQKKDDNGNVIQEAQSIVKLFQNADKSTLLHEIGHIFLNKLKNLARAGLLRNNKGKLNNAGIDWGIIMREYGLKDIDFSKELSGKDLELWHNAQENFASSLEKYFWKGQAPQSFSQRIKHVFKAFKSWLQNIYHSLSDIKYTDAKGKQHAFSLSKDIKAVFDDLLADDSNLTSQAVQNSNQRENTAAITENITDREILPSKINDKTKNTDNIPAVSENRNQTENNSNQRTNDRGGFFSWLKRIGNHVMHPLYSIAHVPTITDGRDFAIPNPESNRRFLEAMNTPSTATRLGVFGRINQFMHDTAKAIRGGDYSDITNSPRKNDPQLKLLDALHALRKLGRDKITAADKAVSEMTDIIKTLNPKQRQLLNYYTVFRDLLFQIEDMPGSDLGFNLTEKDVRDMNKKLTPMVLEDHTIYDAVKKLDDSIHKQNEEFMRLARLLGKNVDGLFRNPHYFRHRIINYMQAARTRTLPAPARGNLDIQNRFDAEFRQIMGRDFFKKRKGSEFDFITDYVMANAEVRAQLAQDIETMKTLLQIKKMHDIAPTLRKKFGNGDNSQQGLNSDGSQTFSQSGETQHSAWLNHLPDGMTALDPSVIGLIESDKSAHDNILDMAVREISDKFGIPLDRLVEQGLTVEDNIMVIPTEIAETLRKMAKSRHRGMLGQAAKDFTTWWKRAVLFTPTRNLLYNIRNFTGDIDALIAGNPHALKHFPRAVKELAGYFLHRGKKDYEASQDLKDYIRLSGNLGIQSLNLSARDAQAMIDLIPTPEKTKSGKTFPKRAEKEAARLQRAEQRAQENQESRELTQKFSKIKNALGVPMEWVQKFFSLEHGFTEMREHLLRYAAYIDYKNQMESNKDGRPNNWGASIEEEVMAIDDIKERAFKMSNELLGAYDQISEVGKQLRDMLIPFYSWMEVNMRRTYRLLKNGFKYGKGMQAVQGYLKGKAYTMPLYAIPAAWSVAKLMMFTGALQLFNRFVMPDADDDLPNDVKYRPHITLGERNGRVYYFDRIGAIADALDWFSLDSFVLDAKDLANGQQTLGGYMKKIIQAPFSKVINGLNPAIKMPFELAMGRSMFPNAFSPSTIRDPAEYIARSFGMAWPYKVITGKPHNNLQELSHLIVYSQDTDEAAYWQTLDRVRQFQNQVLDKHFDGFASTARGRILQNIKKALRYNDKEALRRFLREYTQADGTKQGLKQSMKAMHPLHGLSEKEKAQFLKWISPDDRKFLRKAERYFHHLADRFIR